MHRVRLIPVALLLCMTFFALGAEKDAKTIALFDGQDLAKWTYYLKDSQAEMSDVWQIEDGVIVCQGTPPGYLRTKKDYGNYKLTLQWRWTKGSKGGNSGVLLHTQGKDKVWPKSIESQLMAGNAGDFWTIGGTSLDVPNEKQRKKGRRFLNLTDDSEKPFGQWNTMEIVCRDDEIIVHVNGEKVNSATNCSVTEGAICLQSEGAEIHFRNIILEPLKP